MARAPKGELVRRTTPTTRRDARTGVYKLGPGRFRVRGEYVDPVTKTRRELDRMVDAETPAAAARVRTALLAEAKSRKPAPEVPAVVAVQKPSIPTLSEFVAHWAETKRKEGAFKKSTRQLLDLVLCVHLLPSLGAIRLDELNNDAICGWLDGQAEAAAETVNGRLRVALRIIGAGLRRYQLPRGWLDDVESRQVPPPTRRKALTAAELEALLDELRRASPRWYPLVLVLARTGMRFGEATALRWEDVDREAGTLTIRRAQWHGEVGTTKNGRERIVAMTPDVRAMLDARRVALMAEQDPGHAAGWIFTTHPKRGPRARRVAYSHLQPSSLRKPLMAAAKAAGIAVHVHPHALRHTANDLMRQNDPLGIVTQSAIGHADAKMTARYSHVTVTEQAALMRRAFPGAFSAPSGENPGSAHDARGLEGKGPTVLQHDRA